MTEEEQKSLVEEQYKRTCLPPTQKIIAIDSQMLEHIQLCERKWYYTFSRNLLPETTKDYLERGDLLHHILAWYYGQIIKGQPHDAAAELAVNEGYKYAAKLNLTADECEVVIKNFLAYCIYYVNDQWEPVFVEKSAAKIIFEDEKFKFIYQGRIDFGVLIPGVTGVVPVDHKHSKRRGTALDLVNQFIGYCWLLDCNNLVKNEIGFQKTLKPEDRFNRLLFSYDDERINEWVGNSVKWIKRLIQCIESDEWLMNLSSCNKFDGCIFAGICTASPSHRENIIRRQFNVGEKWDVGTSL